MIAFSRDGGPAGVRGDVGIVASLARNVFPSESAVGLIAFLRRGIKETARSARSAQSCAEGKPRVRLDAIRISLPICGRVSSRLLIVASLGTVLV